MRAVATFAGYTEDGLALLGWTGSERVPVGTSFYALPVLDRAPVIVGQQVSPAGLLDKLADRIKEMKEAAYTFGDYSEEAVCIALDGVLEEIERTLAAGVAANQSRSDK